MKRKHDEPIKWRLPPIRTPEERALHVAKYAHHYSTDEARELMGDMATMNSNQYHDSYTGFNEFYPDTPEWIIAMAERRGWHNRETTRTLQERAYSRAEKGA